MTPPSPRLKVCCIQSIAEAHLAIAAGADAIGLVAAMPSGPGPIPDPLIREIAAAVPAHIATFLLTSRTRPADIVDHLHATGCNTVQLCDLPDAGTYAALRRELPSVRIVQVIHVQDEASLIEARAAFPRVDLLLLDSGRTRLTQSPRELGGTARTHDWLLSARIVAESPIPVLLAGGLTAANIAQAIAAVRPAGVDLCNGVRTAGQLDPDKLAAFVTALRAATAGRDASPMLSRLTSRAAAMAALAREDATALAPTHPDLAAAAQVLADAATHVARLTSAPDKPDNINLA